MHTRVFAFAVGCIASLVFAGSVAALCLGCPPVAWKAKLHLKDGGEVLGYVELSAFLVENRVDLTGPELPGYWKGWAPEELRVWTRALSVHQIYDGFCRTGWSEEAEDPPTPCSFTLPPRRLLLVGEPRIVPLEKVTLIEDASCLEECMKLYGTFRVTPSEADLLIEPPHLALKERVGNTESVAYCFAYDPEITLDELLAFCKNPPWTGNLAEPSAGIVRLLDDAGT